MSLIQSGVIKLDESQEVDENILKVIQKLSEEEVDLIISMRKQGLIPAVYSEGYYCHLIEDLLGFKDLSGDLVGKVKFLNSKKIIDVQEWEWGTQPFSLLKPIDQLDENKIEVLENLIKNNILSTARVSDFEYFSFLTAEELECAKKNIETLKKCQALCSDPISIGCINNFAKLSEKDVAQMAKEYEKKEKYPYEFFQNDQ